MTPTEKPELAPPYVSSVAPGIWVLESPHSLVEGFADLGEVTCEGEQRFSLRHSPSDDCKMASVAAGLRSLGFHFADGRDWSPQAYLRHLRDAGQFAGPIPQISWLGSGKFRLRDDT